MTYHKKLNSDECIFICFGIGFNCFCLFFNDISMIFGVFLIVPIFVCVVLLFIVMLIWAVIYTIRRIKYGWRTWIPLAILTLIAVMYFTVPYEKVYKEADYFINQPRREAIVKRILADELYTGEAGLLLLPFGFRDLSLDKGNILLQRYDEYIEVFFCKTHAIMDHGGYFYISNDDMSKLPSYAKREKIKGHWYYGWH